VPRLAYLAAAPSFTSLAVASLARDAAFSLSLSLALSRDGVA